MDTPAEYVIYASVFIAPYRGIHKGQQWKNFIPPLPIPYSDFVLLFCPKLLTYNCIKYFMNSFVLVMFQFSKTYNYLVGLGKSLYLYYFLFTVDIVVLAYIAFKNSTKYILMILYLIYHVYRKMKESCHCYIYIFPYSVCIETKILLNINISELIYLFTKLEST